MSQYSADYGPADYFPPLAALFQGDVLPSSAALQSLIAEIDAQLDSNSKQLDRCLQSILSSANNLPGVRTFSHPKDALGYICSSHTLEKDTCYDPQQDEAVAIIKALSDSLEKHPGSEESVLQEILKLASDEGLILPLRSSPTASISQSSSSLNMQLDSMDQLIEGKWATLSQSIQKHITAELLKVPSLAQNLQWSWAISERRLNLIGGLRALQSDYDAWVSYRNIRGQQLEQLFSSLLPESDSENVNYKEFCANCDMVANGIMEMIEEDFTVLSTGIFKKVGGMYHILHDVYLEKYSDEMSVLIEEIADDIRDFNKKVVKASRSDHGLAKTANKSMTKNGSGASITAGSSPNVWAAVNPSYSQSMDTMFLASSFVSEKDKPDKPAPMSKLQKQPSLSFPKDCITALRHIVLSLLKMEDFLDSLTRMTSWDITGLPLKKGRKKKSSLRGVLKCTSSPEQKRHSLTTGGSFSSSDTPYDSANPVAVNTSPGQQSDTGPPPKRQMLNYEDLEIGGSCPELPAASSVRRVSGKEFGSQSPQVIERNRSEDKIRWDWRLIFKKISSGLASAVETKIDMTMSSTLQHETALWAKGQSLERTWVGDIAWTDGFDQPPVVSKDTLDFIQIAEELLPLAKAGMEGCLMPVRTAFIDSLMIAVKSFHLHCVTLSKDVPHKASVKQLLVILSDAMFVKNYLQHVENSLSSEETGQKFMSAMLKQYTELVHGLGKHVLQLHHQFISTSVLSDADSGNWADLKEFHEDERCSFTIQMWNFYLRGVQEDMWQILAPRRAQSLFSSVLQDSLLLLMQRYARVKPSFRRVPQLRYDITSILLCTCEHLLSASSSVSQFLDPGHNQLPHYSIHNQCSNLLAIMAVVTSPVELVYRIFKRGYNRKMEGQSSGDSLLMGNNSNWLHWMWPSLVQASTKHVTDMEASTALYLHLRLFLSQPQTDWGMLVQALIMKNSALAVLLLSRICLLESSQSTLVSEALRYKPGSITDNKLSISVASLVTQSSTQTSKDSNSPVDSSPSPARSAVQSGPDTDKLTEIQQTVDVIVHVLAKVHYFPDALSKCLVPVIDKCLLWDLFNSRNLLVTPHMKLPEWMTAVFKLMDPFIERVVEPMLRYVKRVRTTENYIQPVISYVADLPCGCPPSYSLKDHPKPAGVKEALSTCVQLVIVELEKSIVMLPSSLCCLFNSLQNRCEEQNIKTSHKCVALQIIAWAVRIKLQQFPAETDKLGTIFSPEVRAHIGTVADTLFYVLVQGKTPNTPAFAARFFQNNKDWLGLKFQSITSFICDEFHSMASTDMAESSPTDFTDHIYSILAASMMSSPAGYRGLELLCHLVRNNSQWLLDQLDVQPPVSSPEDKQTDPEFKLDLSPPSPAADMNPIRAMNSIGQSTFNQEVITKFSLDWVSLLSSDLGLSRAAFRNLLVNRPELQEGAVLEEADKKPVDVLRAVYEL